MEETEVTEVNITLNGESDITVDKFFPYVDEGARAFDNLGEEVSVQAISNVNTDVSGIYTVTYYAGDKPSGIYDEQVRQVTVKSGPVKRPLPFDTFAVSTNDSWKRLPSNNASEMRLTNYCGKAAGIRLRHKTYVIDDFEEGFDNWEILSGTLGRKSGLDIAGKNSAELEGRIAKAVPYLGDEFAIQISFHALYGDVKVGLFDSLARVGMIDSGTAGTTVQFYNDGKIGTSAPSVSTARWKEDKTYVLTIEVHPTSELFTAELFDGVDRQVIAQGLDSTNDLGNGGGVRLPGTGYFLGIDATSCVIDEVLYVKKHSEPHEILASGSSYTFPCQANTNEYEVINLGSDGASYMDNTDSITLTGFYR